MDAGGFQDLRRIPPLRSRHVSRCQRQGLPFALGWTGAFSCLVPGRAHREIVARLANRPIPVYARGELWASSALICRVCGCVKRAAEESTPCQGPPDCHNWGAGARTVAIMCPRCGAGYDVTLFQFGRAVRCDCGTWVDLRGGHVVPDPALRKEHVAMAETEIGKVTHYFSKAGVAAIEITAGSMSVGDTIRIKGHTRSEEHTS